ncbi:hypothetical protein [Stenotrophomonas sp. PD6]|uniref:hypothetical protein n=1 Tax=Stenotrophomonas sp. PD6 TaxID=3368612 RepID=UPI003B9FEED5
MLMALATVALGVWMFYFLPGWIGIVVATALLLGSVVASVLLWMGAIPREKVARLWKEFLNALYGL